MLRTIGLLCALCAMPGCSGHKLVFHECYTDVAVGSDLRCSVQLVGREVECRSVGKLGTCQGTTNFSPATITGAQLVPENVFKVVKTEGSVVTLRATASGQATLKVEAEGEGDTHSGERQLLARVPDALRLRTLCIENRHAAAATSKIITLPVSTNQQFTLQLLAGESPLVSQRYPVVDVGALTLQGKQDLSSDTFTCRTPAAGVKTEITSSTFPAFKQPVQVFDLQGITGLALLPSPPGAIKRYKNFSVDVAVKVGDAVACKEMAKQWTKTVTTETPTVCAFTGTLSGKTTLKVSDPTVVKLRTIYDGTCRLVATLDGTNLRETLEINVGSGTGARDSGAGDGGGGQDAAPKEVGVADGPVADGPEADAGAADASGAADAAKDL